MFCIVKRLLPLFRLIPFLMITTFWILSCRRSDHVRFLWHGQTWEFNAANQRFSIDNQPEVSTQQDAIQAKLDANGKSKDVNESKLAETTARIDAVMGETVESLRRKVVKPAPMHHEFYILVVPNEQPQIQEPQAVPRENPPANDADYQKQYEDRSARLDALFLEERRLYKEQSNLHYKRLPMLMAKLGLNGQVQSVALPHPWMLAFASLILPAMRYRRLWIMNCRRRKRLCNVCGYDLRSTPDRCPECGTMVRPWLR